MGKLKKINITGFKSIKNAEIEIGPVNVLIGANGAGKSNLCQLLKIQTEIAKGMFQNFLRSNGNPKGYFFKFPKVTSHIWVKYTFDNLIYDITLKYGPEQVFIELEKAIYKGKKYHGTITANQTESDLKNFKDRTFGLEQNYAGEKTKTGELFHNVFNIFSNWRTFHFRDTSILAAMRLPQSIHDFRFLKDDGSNIASFIKHLAPDKYRQLRNIIRLAMPNFDDFLLEPEALGDDVVIRLQWRQEGFDDVFQPHQLSDGTLSFICLAAALIGETETGLMVFDEPELGLHPSAITVIASLMKSVSDKTRIIVTTQSPSFLDYFELESVIVVEQDAEGESKFRVFGTKDLKKDKKRLETWLEDYSLGQLWEKNELGGRPNG